MGLSGRGDGGKRSSIGFGYDKIRRQDRQMWRGDLAKRRTAPLGCEAAPK
ncbi:protein of unknown function [Pseudomonas mediterranea]